MDKEKMTSDKQETAESLTHKNLSRKDAKNVVPFLYLSLRKRFRMQ